MDYLLAVSLVEKSVRMMAALTGNQMVVLKARMTDN